MLKTLAAKHQSTVIKMAAKHKATIETPNGPRACYEARIERPGKEALVARFGGIPVVRNRRAVLVDRTSSHQVIYPRKELVRRLLTRRCELCGEPGAVTVHQVRNLASLEMHTGQPPVGGAHAQKAGTSGMDVGAGEESATRMTLSNKASGMAVSG